MDKATILRAIETIQSMKFDISKLAWFLDNPVKDNVKQYNDEELVDLIYNMTGSNEACYQILTIIMTLATQVNKLEV